MDRLIERIEQYDNPSVVGLDPTLALLPEQLLQVAQNLALQYVQSNMSVLRPSLLVNTVVTEHTVSLPAMQVVGVPNLAEAWQYAIAQVYALFNALIVDAVADIVPAVKPQIAMVETLGTAGIACYTAINEYAQQRGLYVIGDIKRGDIGSTSAAYAKHLTGESIPQSLIDEACKLGICTPETAPNSSNSWHEDAITVNPYLGSDGIDSFVEAAQQSDNDIFVLVKTSNPSSAQLQDCVVTDGERMGTTLFERVADYVEQWGESSRGRYGYSRVGAVVGATHPQAGRRLRERMPHTMFLVPGFGAQGGSANDVAVMFDVNGRGAIINSSRGIIGSWRNNESYNSDLDVEATCDIIRQSARQSAMTMRDALRQACKER